MLPFVLGFMLGMTLGVILLACLVASREEAPQPERRPAPPHPSAANTSLDDLGADYAASSPVGAKG